MFEQIPKCKFALGDKVKIPYISDCNKLNGKVGEVTWIHPYKFYPGGDVDNWIWKHQMQITYPDGDSIMADPDTKPSGIVSEVVLVKAMLEHMLTFASELTGISEDALCEVIHQEQSAQSQTLVAAALSDCLQKANYESAKIRFAWLNMETRRIEQTVAIPDLIKDWYNDALFCPENDASVHVISIFDENGTLFATDGNLELSFETLMNALEGQMRASGCRLFDKQVLDAQIQSAETRAAALQTSQERPAKVPER